MKLSFGICIVYTLAIFLCVFMGEVQAQESQILSVTPPLFQVSALPGNVWQSSIKVVNGNPYPMTVYAEVVNFKAYGEEGQGKFIPLVGEDPEHTTLGSWINIKKEPYTISPEQSLEIPFTIEVPFDAPPGGHYAAVLVSTQPPSETADTPSVITSQAVTSLFFVRIEGDVQELGTIREFRVLDRVIPRPEAEFSLRFENKGNVHLQPRGDIVIQNMWGTVRGTIPVNYQTNFGNVLPESIRDFTFSWKSDFEISDIGRYKAIATLAYGDGEMKNTSSVAYFWIIPVQATLITLIVILLFVYAIVWMVKAYIRRMLTLAGVPITTEDNENESIEETQMHSQKSTSKTYTQVSAPLKNGVLDLRARLDKVEERLDVFTTVVHFIIEYKRFFIAVLILITLFVTSVLYISNATDPDKAYEVIIDTELD